jgi:hypothetical protein
LSFNLFIYCYLIVEDLVIDGDKVSPKDEEASKEDGQNVIPNSTVVKIDEIVITANNLNSVFNSATLPFKMTVKSSDLSYLVARFFAFVYPFLASNSRHWFFTNSFVKQREESSQDNIFYHFYGLDRKRHDFAAAPRSRP